MRDRIEEIWEEYFAEKCSVIDSKEEWKMSKEVVNMHERVKELLTKEQSEAVEEYVDVLCEMQSSFVKKAFFRGCGFTIAFFSRFL